MKKVLSAALLAASALLFGSPISAHATTYNRYTNSTDFFAAAPVGTNTYNVSGTLSGASTYTLGPITATDNSAGELSISKDGTFGSGVSFLSSNGATVEFAADSAKAFGFWLSSNGADLTITYKLSDFSSRTLTVSGEPTVQFIGFVSGVSIHEVTFSSYGDGIDFTEFATDSPYTPPVAATPEPSSIALLGTGVLSMSGMVRKRFKRA